LAGSTAGDKPASQSPDRGGVMYIGIGTLVLIILIVILLIIVL
jgi:hypothetical protein